MMALLLDHLWQSSLCVAGAGLLALALRRNGANVRFWLWFAASVKFLVPFALLTALGAYLLAPIVPPVVAPLVPQTVAVMKPLAKPFSATATGMAVTLTPTNASDAPAILLTTAKPAPAPAIPKVARPAHLNLASIALALWLAGFLIITLRWLVRWSRVRALLQGAVTVQVDAPIAVKFSSSRLEPGLVGILKPVILLPHGIEQQLSHRELKAVLAHELAHWRRRDNLLAAIHMLVEALFWFFPLVWWLGARLNAERERACDESVLAQGNDPQMYAEGILKVCRAYLQSPLACVAGVSGAGLKQRIDQIMENRLIPQLNAMRKLVLSASAALVLVPPLLLGLAAVPVAQLQAKTAAIPTIQKIVIAAASIARSNDTPSPMGVLPSESETIAKTATPPAPTEAASQTVLASNAPPAPEISAADLPSLPAQTTPVSIDTGSEDVPHPKTEPGLRCLLGLWPAGCERLFEDPRLTYCAGQGTGVLLTGSTMTTVTNGGGAGSCGNVSPERIEYLGTNAAGDDVYSVKSRHGNDTYVLPQPGPDGKIATGYKFEGSPAGAVGGVRLGGFRAVRGLLNAETIPGSYARVTAPVNPPRILYTRPAEGSGTADAPHPKTEPGLRCLLGFAPDGCWRNFDSQPYARLSISNFRTCYNESTRVWYCPLESVDYLGTNAAGDDVYAVRFRNNTETYILPQPDPDGKIATRCRFDSPPSSAVNGVCLGFHIANGSIAQVTSPEAPVRILFTRQDGWTVARPKGQRPKTEAGVRCLLGLGSNGCETVFENPARQAVTYCAGQYAGSGGSIGANGGLYAGRCPDGPLESIEYLGSNAAGDDVYLARFQNKNFTYILPPPGPDGKIATRYAFDSSPAGGGASARVTSPASPPQFLYSRPAEWK